MTIRGKIAVMVAVVAIAMGAGAKDFRWMLNGTGESRTYGVKGIPETGTYTVRFRAALMNAHGGRLRIDADGVLYDCLGNGMMLAGGKENHVVPGQVDSVNFDFLLRNRRYHDFVFVCTPDEIVLFGDGDEKRAVKKAPGAPRGFALIAENIDLDVVGFESSESDMRGIWTCRNQAINGGFETLCNGYPIGWGTFTFGFETAETIGDPVAARRDYRVDDTVAWEGKHSMRIASGMQFWECWRRRVDNTAYVFSFYAKALKAGTGLTMNVVNGYQPVARRKVTVGTEWTRFELPFTAKEASMLRVGIQPSGDCVWVDAMQLERGEKAMDFVTRPVPTEEVPPDPPKVMDHYYVEQVKPVRPSGKPPRMDRVVPSRNAFRVNGKEMFPFGYCLQGGWFGSVENCTKVYDTFQKWGFNFFEWFSGYPDDPELLRRALEEAGKRGLYVELGIGFGVKAGKFKENELKVVKAVAHMPNVLFVNVFDEMYAVLPPEKRREPMEFLRRELGPDVPVKFNEFDLGVINNMDWSLADIASGDFYVVGQQEVSAQYYVLKQFRDQHPDQLKTFYPFAAGHFTNNWLRDATPDEVLAQAYNGYVLELFNIIWFAAIPLTEPAQDAVVQAKSERDLIDPSAFLDGTPVDIRCESHYDAVKFTARRLKNGVTRLIALNIENRPNAAKWTLPSAPKSAKALIGKGPDKITGTTIEDGFGPLERRVYDLQF